MIIIKEKMNMDDVRKLAEGWYGTMIKGCVDIEREKVALGGDYHMETCELLVVDGSIHTDVWGFNIRFEENPNGELEFDSLVNIKPALGNKTRAIENNDIVEKSEKIIRSLIEFT